MRAVVIHETGGPEVLRWEEIPRPEPGDGEVLIRGQTALIAGAAGGVGHFAVQFAKHAGARTIGTGSSANRDFVLGLGADQYVDYTRENVADAVSDVDVALDTVGGDNGASLLPAVREGGILLGIAGGLPEEPARARGVRTRAYGGQARTDELARVADLVVRGEVHIEIAEVLPLTEVARAHERSESGHVRGKLVLTLTT